MPTTDLTQLRRALPVLLGCGVAFLIYYLILGLPTMYSVLIKKREGPMSFEVMVVIFQHVAGLISLLIGSVLALKKQNGAYPNIMAGAFLYMGSLMMYSHDSVMFFACFMTGVVAAILMRLQRVEEGASQSPPAIPTKNLARAKMIVYGSIIFGIASTAVMLSFTNAPAWIIVFGCSVSLVFSLGIVMWKFKQSGQRTSA